MPNQAQNQNKQRKTKKKKGSHNKDFGEEITFLYSNG
jgi:hypothetical protein